MGIVLNDFTYGDGLAYLGDTNMAQDGAVNCMFGELKLLASNPCANVVYKRHIPYYIPEWAINRL